ncbi:cupin domain-containing protein [Salicibibacter cibarius]|uniref:Cupin domain-containing protein n=1 Tax=Salicibibacter cibarius TaxID=2743000 RepID=A0A7T7CAI9_9BACI|nr:cupin domain-containing protein [Salicibibacter cibarius]QQK74764.1 cupin domain-containing protein [Salicibibacter cibarius]
MNVKNIHDAKRYDDHRLGKQTLFEAGKSKVIVFTFMPGQELPTHGHPHAQAYVLVLEGNGVCQIDETEHAIRAGDALHCDKTETIRLENTGDEPMSVYVVLAREPKTEG